MTISRHSARSALLLVSLSVGLVACGEQAPKAAAPQLTVLVSEAMERDVPLRIDMVGTTLGTQDVPIRARVEGFLESMDFEEGTFVKQDDLLYTIERGRGAKRRVPAVEAVEKPKGPEGGGEVE